MEDPCIPFDWGFFHEEEGMEDLWHSLLHKTLELETRVSSAKEEIIKKEDELAHLKDFLSRAIWERDEAESKCQSIMLDIVTLQQQLQPQQKQESVAHNAVVQQAKDTPCFDNDIHETTTIVSQEGTDSVVQVLPPAAEKLVAGKPLPEKGKLLQAVMEAGPLLQTLLLAGPLPEWQHPPPRVDSVEIPPVAISRPPPQSLFRQDSFSCLSHKRSLPDSEASVFPSNTKCQKVALY